MVHHRNASKMKRKKWHKSTLTQFIQLFTSGTQRLPVFFSFTGFQITPVTSKDRSLCLVINLSPVCAAADLLCAGLGSLLHNLRSDEVQRNPHTKCTCGEGHRGGRQGGEHVAPAGGEEAHTQKNNQVIIPALRRGNK